MSDAKKTGKSPLPLNVAKQLNDQLERCITAMSDKPDFREAARAANWVQHWATVEGHRSLQRKTETITTQCLKACSGKPANDMNAEELKALAGDALEEAKSF